MATYEEAKIISEHLIQWNKDKEWWGGIDIRSHPILDWYIVVYSYRYENIPDPYSIDDVVIHTKKCELVVPLKEIQG